MSGVKSQNLSIMMTDIQGYTDASSSSSREEIINLIRRHNQLMIPIIQFYGGNIIKSIGDAFLCTFHSATDAVICAIMIQSLLKDYNEKQQTSAKKMKLRVVINTGDVTLEKSDIYGDAVNITARMEGLSCFPGGSIGISESTYLLMNRNEITAEKIGPQTLKGIPEPVNVFKIPLEKQKSTAIPEKLAIIVDKALKSGSASNADAVSAIQFNEWNNAVLSFLKEKNWGENISAMLDENKIRENVTKIQGQIVKTFSKENVANVQKQFTDTFNQKTVLQSKKVDELNEASLPSRMKSFLIDAAILLVVWYAVFYVIWWPVQSMVWGKEYISGEEMLTKYAIKNIGDKEAFEAAKRFKESLNYDSYTGRYYRPKGFIEELISFNMKCPFIFFILYFGLSWAVRGASPGQIAARTAIVSEDGSKLDLITAFKRATIFVFSNAFFGVGAAMILTEGRLTLYDKICHTRVVE